MSLTHTADTSFISHTHSHTDMLHHTIRNNTSHFIRILHTPLPQYERYYTTEETTIPDNIMHCHTTT